MACSSQCLRSLKSVLAVHNGQLAKESSFEETNQTIQRINLQNRLHQRIMKSSYFFPRRNDKNESSSDLRKAEIIQRWPKYFCA